MTIPALKHSYHIRCLDMLVLGRYVSFSSLAIYFKGQTNGNLAGGKSCTSETRLCSNRCSNYRLPTYLFILYRERFERSGISNNALAPS